MSTVSPFEVFLNRGQKDVLCGFTHLNLTLIVTRGKLGNWKCSHPHSLDLTVIDFVFMFVAVAAVSQHEDIVVHSVAADEMPPPYTPTGYGSIPMINCKVCQAMISLQGRMNQLVVKCSSCNEATVCSQCVIKVL